MREKAAISITKLFTVGLFLFISANATSAASQPYQYTVNVAEDLSGLTVKTCFTGNMPQRLISYDDAVRYLKSITLISGNKEKPLRPVERAIAMPTIKPGDCIRYEVNFKDKITHPWFNKRQSKDHQVLVDIHRWLWFPDPFNIKQDAIDITFKLPNNMSISTPWRQIAQGNNFVTYRYDQRPRDWEGRIAIGRFKIFKRTIGKAKINIAVLNGHPAADQKALLQWVNKNLDALAMAYGDFPVPRLQLLVVPVGKDPEPVTWGQVMRGGGDAVHVYIDQTQTLENFLDDWVLIHELSHLLHPWINGKDPWLYEGLGSYYQNVLRARAGLLTPQQAWANLHQGFQRGIQKTLPGRTLAQVSENMSRNKNFMRVYWSGAAIALLADYKLRQQSNGKQSLDTALNELHHCCLPTRHLWEGLELMKKLDEITGTEVFTGLYNQYISSTKFPDMTAIYRELGLTVQGKKLILDDHAPAANIRKAIMSSTK